MGVAATDCPIGIRVIVRPSHFCGGSSSPVDLAAKGEPRLLAETEGADVAEEPLVAQPHRQLGRPAVARMADDPGDGQLVKRMVLPRKVQMPVVVVDLGDAAVKRAVPA